MSRKVFISFLGAGNYTPCRYVYGNFKSEMTRFVQVATLQYLCNLETWTEQDVSYIMLTRGAEQQNWEDCEDALGLKSEFAKARLPLRIVPVKDLPDGNNENEIWTIFERAFALIQEGDELYFDLTHGFRYLPMLMLVMSNYSKFLRGTTVRFMSYGKVEGMPREADKPLINLLPLAALQDWTVAAASFVESGNVSQLADMTESRCREILKETRGQNAEAKLQNALLSNLRDAVADMLTCRGINIIKANNVSKLLRNMTQVEDSIIPPLTPVFDKIKEAFAEFDSSENVRNGFAAARWCIKNRMYQQAATILQETVTSYIAIQHDIAINDEERRKLVNSAFFIVVNNTPETEWKDISEENRQTVRLILENPIVQNREMIGAYTALSDIRNDINHAGMRCKKNPAEAKNIGNRLARYCDLITNILYGEQYPS